MNPEKKVSPTQGPSSSDFSIVLGGPFFQLLHKAHLTGSSLELLKFRLLTISLLAWLPLLVLSIIDKKAWGDQLTLPFIEDLETHIRFLVAIPLMIVAELLVHQRMRVLVNQFEERELIPEASLEHFKKAIASAYRLRNSYLAEVMIVVIIYVIGYNVVWEKTMALNTTTWYSDSAGGNGTFSLAGLWFRYVSLPLFQFLFLRWYYRLFIWARFLWQVSRIKLNLRPSHPDEVGGLGFLSYTVYTMMPLAVMHGAVLAGMIANHIFHEGNTLLDYKIVILVVVLLVQCLVVLPLLMFSFQLSEVKRSASLDYGKLASNTVHAFEERWMANHKPAQNYEPGTPPFFEAHTTYRNVVSMSALPVNRMDIIMLAVSTVVPLLPLLLTMMPLSEILKMAAGFLF